MSGLSKLSTALVIIFIISLVALFAQLFYVLWRRRIFHRQTPSQATMQNGAAADSSSQTFSDSSSNTFTSFSSSSKEQLLYFFSLSSGQISRVEPNSTPPIVNSAGSRPEDEMEVIDVFKLRNMYGLFTIKEEYKENDKAADDESTPQQAVAVAVGGDHVSMGGGVTERESTPFSTPCESPLYFTPASSPTRELVDSG